MEPLTFENVGRPYRRLFRPSRFALSDVSFRLQPGEIVALVGPNGSGKTTSINLALGLLRPTEGAITVFGYPPGSPQANRKIGWMPDRPGFPTDMSARQLLSYWLGRHGLRKQERTQRLNELLDYFEMASAADTPTTLYSAGMKQKTSLMMALAHKPLLLVLDEPISTLDRDGRLSLRRHLEVFAEQGGTALISSHRFAELEPLCKRALVLSSGRLVDDIDLPVANGAKIVVLWARDLDGCKRVISDSLQALVANAQRERSHLKLRLRAGAAIPDLVEQLVARGVQLEGIREDSGQLSGLFKDLIEY